MSILPYRFRLDRSHTLYQGLEYAGLGNLIAQSQGADQPYFDSGPNRNQSATLDGCGWGFDTTGGHVTRHVHHPFSQGRVLIPGVYFNDPVGTIVITYRKFGDSGLKWDYLWDCFGASRTLFAFSTADQAWLYTNGGDRGSILGLTPYTNFTWHTLVFVWGVNDLYMDGKFHGSFSNGGMGTDVGTYVLGDRQSNTQEGFWGNTQKFMVYSRALSLGEIEIVSNFQDQMMGGFVQKVPETKRHFFVTAPPVVPVTGIFDSLIIGV